MLLHAKMPQCHLFIIDTGNSRIVHVVLPCLLVLISSLWHDTNQLEEIMRLVAEQILQVTNKSVDVPFAGRFMDNIFVVVIAQAA